MNDLYATLCVNYISSEITCIHCDICIDITALNDPRASLVFIDGFILLEWMIKYVLLVRIKIYIYILHFATHGLPITNVPDNGPCFTSSEFEQLKM